MAFCIIVKKIKMKKILLMATCMFVVVCLNAQDDYKKFGFGLGLNTAFPIANIKNTMPIGRGINLQTAYRFNSRSEVSLQINSDYFDPKTNNIFSDGFLCLNAMIGGRYHIIPKYLVVGGGVGYGYLTDEVNLNEGGFAFSPEIGMSTRRIQVLLHYTSVNTTNSKAGILGFRTTYFF